MHRTPKSSGRPHSLFFQDLASPVPVRKGRVASPSQAAAVPALWRENFGGSDLPPPPMYTLEDLLHCLPEPGILDYPLSPGVKSDTTSAVQSSAREFVTPGKGKAEASTSFALKSAQQSQPGSGSSSWWSPAKAGGGEQEEKAKCSNVEGVVQPGAPITLPTPQEVARPKRQKSCLPAEGNLDEEVWVTVYGLSPGDTNLVLREFEKCGVILKHVPGPREANWIHLLYQNRSDARKALNKNGMQINGVLIIGVKPVGPTQRQALNERLNDQGFMSLPPPPSTRASDSSTSKASEHPCYLQNGSTGAQQSGGAIASPTKSIVSKFCDVMFGI